VSISVSLIVLAFFKYFGFFVSSATALLRAVGLNVTAPILDILLPVGISFYTFHTLAYIIDVYRGRVPPTSSFTDFSLYVTFFPQLIAGPIQRPGNLMPQIQDPRVVTQEHWNRGVYLILVGLVRKVVIADLAGAIADPFFASPQSYTSLQLIVGLLLYSLQIYGDFAGYTDIARGSALLLGFDLLRNFRHPYFATSLTDFWHRWHISLSTWLRDYLYIPLGGNRRGRKGTYLNLFVTMLIGGLWHGASWNFVVWGGIHGAGLGLERALQARRTHTAPQALLQRAFEWVISASFIFAVVSFLWLFFRLSDLTAIHEYLRGLTALNFEAQLSVVPFLVLAGLTLLIDVPQALLNDEFCYLRLHPLPLAGFASAAVILILLSIGGQSAPFIYFQF
jgi:D-alanyl-lipoteichoic acid acyltransferase DltB (MBOAT superfamily)